MRIRKRPDVIHAVKPEPHNEIPHAAIVGSDFSAGFGARRIAACV
jgi:hypothetical protein